MDKVPNTGGRAVLLETTTASAGSQVNMMKICPQKSDPHPRLLRLDVEEWPRNTVDGGEEFIGSALYTVGTL